MEHHSFTLTEYDNIRRAALDYIDTNYMRERASLEHFVASSTWSRRSVQRALKHFDLSFRQLLMNRRVDEAVRLLRETTLSVADVAKMVAYRQPAQFAKTFRKLTGYTPSGYRAFAHNTLYNGPLRP